MLLDNEEKGIDYELEVKESMLTEGERRCFKDLIEDNSLHGGLSYPKQATIARRLGISIKTLQRYLKRLRELGLVTTIGRGVFATLLYFVHPYFSPAVYDLFNDVVHVREHPKRGREWVLQILENNLQSKKRDYYDLIAYLEGGSSPPEEVVSELKAGVRKESPSFNAAHLQLIEQEQSRFRGLSWFFIDIPPEVDKVPSQSVLDTIFLSLGW